MKLYIISVLVGLTFTGVNAQDAIDVIPPATKPLKTPLKTPLETPLGTPALTPPGSAKTPNQGVVTPEPNRPNAKKAQAQAKQKQAQVAAKPVVFAAEPPAPALVPPAPIPSVNTAKAPAIPAIPTDFGPAPAPAANASVPAVPPVPDVAVTERIVKSTTQGNTARNKTLPLISTATGSGQPFSLRKDMAIASTIEIPLAETIPIGGPPPPKDIETTTAIPSEIGTEVTDVEVTKVSNERIADQLLQTTRGLPVTVETDQNSALIRIGVIKTEPVPSPAPFMVKSVPVPGSLGPSTGPDGIPIAKTIPMDEEAPTVETTATGETVPTVEPNPATPPAKIEIDQLAAEALAETIQTEPATPTTPTTTELAETVATPTTATTADVPGASEWRSIGAPAAAPSVAKEAVRTVEVAEVPATTLTEPALGKSPPPTADISTSASGIPEGVSIKRGWNPFRPKKKVIVPATAVEVQESVVKKSGLFRKRQN